MNARFDRAHGPELDAGAARFHTQAVEAPSRSEGQFFSLAEALPAMVWAARPDGWTEYVNRRWTDYTGLTLEQCRGSGWADALHPADRQRCLKLWAHASQAGEAFEMEYRFRDRNGGHRWFLGRALPVRDAAGHVTRWLGTALDIDDRKRGEVERQRLVSVVENSSDFIGYTTLAGQPVYINGAGLGLVGLRSVAEAQSKHLLDFFPPEQRDFAQDTIVPTVFNRGGWEGEFRFRHFITDEALPVYLNMFLVRDQETGEPIAFATVTRDITAEKAEEEERAGLLAREQAARREAEQANRSKDSFLAALSHELRTPLTPVLLSVTTLETDPRLHPALRDDIRMIRRNVEMEARLIDDLLDLTRVSRGKMELRAEVVDVHRLIHHAVNICRADIEEKGLTLTLDLRAKRSCVRGDGARLQQVVWNLAKNAAKFTPRGGTVNVTTEDAEDDRLVIRVTDTGIGITLDVLPRIFEAFEQGGHETTQQFGGLGLGLAISKALVEAHGGTIAAHSEGRGLGATFAVELPGAGRSSEVACQPLDNAGGIEQRRPLRILLVEDDKDTLRVLSRVLKATGHDVTTAETVASALEAATPESFDLLISDLGLPDGSGLDLMRRLRPLPSIALSGFGMESDVQKAREAGFAVHLTKPIDAERLEDAIQRVGSAKAREDDAVRVEGHAVTTERLPSEERGGDAACGDLDAVTGEGNEDEQCGHPGRA